MVWVYLFFPKFEAMKTNLIAILTGVSVVVVLVSVSFISILKSATSEKTWIVAKGYRISEDVSGLQGPVAIAFLNMAGSKPEDPLYLVTELRGTIKVILNNRQVRKFGELQGVHKATHVLPNYRGAYGLHGLCLSRDDEFLFTTSVYSHGNKLKNKITRWESDSFPKWLRGKPVAELSIPFENGQVDFGHSVGNCYIDRWRKLWVGMGDGGLVSASHNPDISVGKVYRINLDFSAPKDNPFYDTNSPKATRNYVYSMGLRNPWAITGSPSGTIFIADNGPNVDRLVLARPGYDFPWNGSNTSMTYNALLVWPQGIAPAAMVYLDGTTGIAGMKNRIFVTGAADQQVLSIPYKEGLGVLRDPSAILKRSEPNFSLGTLTGLARGPDGIYVAHMVYDEERFFKPSAIIRIQKDTVEP